jgi:nucleotide-binding universal stress UspA family protein
LTEPVFASVVVGTDGSQTAETALRAAVGLARASAAPLHIVSAYEPGFAYRPGGGGHDASRDPRSVAAQEGVLALLDDARELARAEGVGQVDTFAREGDPASAIIDVAAEQAADLIVVGNKGTVGARRLLPGSVPNKVSRNAPCSVLIVRTT